MKQELIDKISIMDNVLFAYLFGSYASNQETQNSDVDIAIYVKTHTLDDELQMIYELSKFLKKDVDLLVLNRTKNLYLLESVFNDGIVIKDHDKRVDFELSRQHDILDYKAFKKSIDAA